MQPLKRGHGLCLLSLLKDRVKQNPHAIALLAPGRKPITYACFLGQIEQTSQALNSLGIGRDDRVAVVVPNGPEMAAVFLGVAAILC